MEDEAYEKLKDQIEDHLFFSNNPSSKKAKMMMMRYMSAHGSVLLNTKYAATAFSEYVDGNPGQEPGNIFFTYTEEEAEIVDKRLNLTLQRLRQHGYCNEKSIKDLCSTSPDIITSIMYCFFNYSFNYPINVYDDAIKKYQDEMWLRAIEEVVLGTTKDVIENDATVHYYGHVKYYIPLLYATALKFIFFSVLNEYNKEYNEHKKTLKKKNKALKKVEAKKQELDREKRNIQEKIAKQADEFTALVKRCNSLEKENEQLKKKLQQAQEPGTETGTETEPDKEAKENENTQTETETSAEKNNEDTITKEMLDQVVIPEDSSVIFLGGHINFVNKVKALHPDWTYLNGEDTRNINIAKIAVSKQSAVIFASKHVSHAVSLAITENISKNIPLVYITATNIDLMEQELRYNWIKEQRRIAENAERLRKTEPSQEQAAVM